MKIETEKMISESRLNFWDKKCDKRADFFYKNRSYLRFFGKIKFETKEFYIEKSIYENVYFLEVIEKTFFRKTNFMVFSKDELKNILRSYS